MNSWIEIGLLALAAVFIISRMLAVMGRREGAEPPALSRPPRPAAPAEPTPTPASEADAGPPPALGLEAPGISDVRAADPSFDPRDFLNGAKAAHGLIAGAFSRGDRAALQPFLTDEVFSVYARAITEREATGAAAPEVLRLKSAEIIEGEVDGPTVRVSVAYAVDVANEARSQTSREIWTFEREARSPDPNWRLAGVAAAS
jgi:predicted lipid-binding transport protein (Tim44 family)